MSHALLNLKSDLLPHTSQSIHHPYRSRKGNHSIKLLVHGPARDIFHSLPFFHSLSTLPPAHIAATLARLSGPCVTESHAPYLPILNPVICADSEIWKEIYVGVGWELDGDGDRVIGWMVEGILRGPQMVRWKL